MDLKLRFCFGDCVVQTILPIYAQHRNILPNQWFGADDLEEDTFPGPTHD